MAQTQDRLGDYVTISGAVRMTGLSYFAIVHRIARRNIPTIRLGGKATLLAISDLPKLAEKDR